MKLQLGQLYKKEELEKYHQEFQGHHEWRFGHNLDKKFFIRFGQFEFWEVEDRVYKCHRTDEGYLEIQVEAFQFHDRNKRKTRQYYTRYDKQNREARKWGSEFK